MSFQVMFNTLKSPAFSKILPGDPAIKVPAKALATIR